VGGASGGYKRRQRLGRAGLCGGGGRRAERHAGEGADSRGQWWWPVAAVVGRKKKKRIKEGGRRLGLTFVPYQSTTGSRRTRVRSG
jgi:hypothetical protein